MQAWARTRRCRLPPSHVLWCRTHCGERRGCSALFFHHTPCYIAPRDLVGQEAFAVIRDALSAKDVVGIRRVVLSNRERPIMLEPMGLGLRGTTLRYTHEIRSEAEYFGEISEMSLPKEMLASRSTSSR